MVLDVVAEGTGVIVENHLREPLHARPGTHPAWAPTSTIDGHTAVVRGVAGLSGAAAMATDLRASASLVIGGLVRRRRNRGRPHLPPDRGYVSKWNASCANFGA